jgi:hypothetical protein
MRTRLQYESGDETMEDEKVKIIKEINDLMDQAAKDELKEYLVLLSALVKNFT